MCRERKTNNIILFFLEYRSFISIYLLRIWHRNTTTEFLFDDNIKIINLLFTVQLLKFVKKEYCICSFIFLFIFLLLKKKVLKFVEYEFLLKTNVLGSTIEYYFLHLSYLINIPDSQKISLSLLYFHNKRYCSYNILVLLFFSLTPILTNFEQS